MLADLSEPQRAVIEAILGAPAGWVWMRPLAEARVEPILAEMHRSRVPRHEALAWTGGLNGHGRAALELVGLGVLDRWEHPDADAVTLSVVAASRLNVILAEFSDGAEPRWIHPEDAKDLYVRRAAGTVELAAAELVPDPAPAPDAEPEIARYSESDMPISILGRLLFIDPTLGKGRPRKPTRAKGKRKAKGRKSSTSRT